MSFLWNALESVLPKSKKDEIIAKQKKELENLQKQRIIFFLGAVAGILTIYKIQQSHSKAQQSLERANFIKLKKIQVKFASSNSSKEGHSPMEEDIKLRCVICAAKERSLIYHPCKHLVICDGCHRKTLDSLRRNEAYTCCICRGVVTSTEKVLVP